MLKGEAKMKENGFTVKRKLKVREGWKYRINVSEGLLDLKPGVVEVVQVGDREEIGKAYFNYDFDSWAIDGDVPKYWVLFEYKDGEREVLPVDEFWPNISRV